MLKLFSPKSSFPLKMPEAAAAFPADHRHFQRALEQPEISAQYRLQAVRRGETPAAFLSGGGFN